MTTFGAQSIREMMYNLGLLLRDSRLVTATAGSTTTLTATNALGLVGGKDNRYANSEIYLWDVPAGATAGPWQITGSVSATGVITLNGGISIGGAIVAGNRAVIQNFNGRGYPQEMKAFALRMAMSEYPGVIDSSALLSSLSTTDYWNAIPAQFRSVYRITFLDPLTSQEVDVSPALWRDIDIQGRRIYLPFDWTSGQQARIWGRLDPATFWSSGDLTTVLDMNAADLIKEAIPWLLMGQRDDKAGQLTADMYNDRMRNRRDVARANEVFLV